MKQKSIPFLFLTACLMLPVAGCKKEESKEFHVEYQNGKVTGIHLKQIQISNTFQADVIGF